MDNIKEAIRKLAQQDGETVALVCIVDDVDKTARTIDCTPVNEGAPLLGVNLQANQGSDFGLVIYPEKGAFVVVGFMADGAAGLMLATDKIESAEMVIGETAAAIDAEGVRVKTAKMSADINKEDIIFNGGELGGLIKIEDLTKRLNLIEKDINKLKTAMSGWIPVSQDGGAALKATAKDWFSVQLTTTKRGDYENTKIKQ